ncbi:hypothetical protein HY990_06665 [Candidatus Micrarchaeota archaeon]|nr:hypothetical protein [Candidatus Micrarchaeota archaeon]
MVRRSLLVLFIASLLVLSLGSFGCVSQKSLASKSPEVLLSSSPVDLDGDALPDYFAYEFKPSGGSFVTKRLVYVSKSSDLVFDSSPSFSDPQLLSLDSALDSFSSSKDQAVNSCKTILGIYGITCNDVRTCNSLCDGGSLKCKSLVNSYPDVVGNSIVSYVRTNNELSSLINDAKRVLFEDPSQFVSKIGQINSKLAALNSNPLLANPQFSLCSKPDYGAPRLHSSIFALNSFSSQSDSYDYSVYLFLTPSGGSSDLSLVNGLSVDDLVPLSDASDFGSYPNSQFSVSSGSSGQKILLNSTSSSGNMVLYYRFKSSVSPDQYVSRLKSPDFLVTSTDLSFLSFTNLFVSIFYALSGNYLISLAFGLALTLWTILILFNVLMFVMNFVSDKSTSMKFASAVKRTFGKTNPHWKGDLVIALILLAISSYLSVSGLVPLSPSASNFAGFFDFAFKNPISILPVFFGFIGFLQVYFALENLTKLFLLERAFGMAIKQEKDLYLVILASIKDKLTVLSATVDEVSNEGLDVRSEYDLITMISSAKIDEMAKNFSPKNRALADEYVTRIDTAIASLNARKKTAADNSENWEKYLLSQLQDQREIPVVSLSSIPAVYRDLAVSRFIKKYDSQFVLEQGLLRRKKMSFDSVASDLIAKNLLFGALVVKNEKPVLTMFSEKGGTLTTALGLKLRNYAISAVRSMVQKDTSSFVIVGDVVAIAYLKSANFDSLLFLNKDKYKESLEQWKAKIKLLDVV